MPCGCFFCLAATPIPEWVHDKRQPDNADLQRVIKLFQFFSAQPADPAPQSGAVQGAQLLQQDDGAGAQGRVLSVYPRMGGKPCLSRPLVMGAAITVGLWRLPTSFCTISTGRTPPCSLPTTGLRSA